LFDIVVLIIVLTDFVVNQFGSSGSINIMKIVKTKTIDI